MSSTEDSPQYFTMWIHQWWQVTQVTQALYSLHPKSRCTWMQHLAWKKKSVMLNIFRRVKVWKVLLGWFKVRLCSCSDRNIQEQQGSFQVSFSWTQHFQRTWTIFQKSYFPLFFNFHLWKCLTDWQNPTDAAAMFWLYGDDTLWRSQ